MQIRLADQNFETIPVDNGLDERLRVYRCVSTIFIYIFSSSSLKFSMIIYSTNRESGAAENL
jgi:hypothetical protein